MIDLKAFIEECAKPYSAANSNCAQAAFAALGKPERLGKAVAEWEAMPEFERVSLVDQYSRGVACIRSLAIRCGLREKCHLRY